MATNKHKGVVFVIWLAISLPLIYSYIRYKKHDINQTTAYDDPGLTGMVLQNNKPEFNFKDWFSGYYQSVLSSYWQDHWSLKGLMVRLNNQLFYEAFNTIRTKGFVSGLSQYIFSENYIFSAYGDDCISEARIAEQMRKAKSVQDSLKAHNIEMLTVFLPGKGMACKPFIPLKYKHAYKTTNHQVFNSQAQKLKLNVLDLYTWFDNINSKVPYPLFPKYGHHWSYYGECLAVDTIIRHLEQMIHADLPDFSFKTIELSDTARERDADVLRSMNLYRLPKQDVTLAYPQIQFENRPDKNIFPVLTIGDSYWYGPVYMGIQQYCFGGGSFWYYNNKIVPKPENASEAWELDLKTELLQHKVVMLVYSDANLSDFGNGFIESAYTLFQNPKLFYQHASQQKQLKSAIQTIRQTPYLLKASTNLSESKHISLDSAIRIMAHRQLTNTL
ncbi:MAG: alginate O-acetyltransferase AlgX-related protein [Bacteroidia bacterium]|jgi:hypothetical protein